MKKAVILLSGGIDSSVCAAIAKKWGFEIYALSFDYGQEHKNELKAASIIAQKLGAIDHKILKIPTLSKITNEQPYVPARNTIFLSFAMGYAEMKNAGDLFIGMNADDTYFPDCSLRFFHAFNSLAAIATKKEIRLNAPLVLLSKSEVIKKAIELEIPLEDTITCYHGNNCGECPACITRIKGFSELHLNDPLIYHS